MRYHYEKLPLNAIDIKMRERAERVLDFVSSELKLIRIPVIWIRPISDDEWLTQYKRTPGPSSLIEPMREEIIEGFTPKDANEVWLRSNLSAYPNLEYTVAHETRHIWQKKNCIAIFNEEHAAEGDAYPYGYEVLKRFLNSTGELTHECEADINSKSKKAQACFLHRWPDGLYKVITTL